MANGTNLLGQLTPPPSRVLERQGGPLPGQPPQIPGQPQAIAPVQQPFGGGIPQTGVIGAESVIRQGTREALGVLGGGIGQAREDISAGGQGIENQAALAGLRGPEAQAAAFQNFQQSPGQQFLQEQAERATTRQAAATGGLGGGNVLRELQRQAIGLAQQDFSNQFQRGQQVLGSQQLQGSNLANLASQQGQLGAGLISGATGQLGGQRFAAGQQLAQAATGTAANLANLQQQLGQGISGITGQGLTNLANLLSGTGQASAQQLNQLSTTLANLGVGGATNAAGFTSLAGQFDAASVQGQNTAVQNAINQLIQSGSFGGGGGG